MREKGKNT